MPRARRQGRSKTSEVGRTPAAKTVELRKDLVAYAQEPPTDEEALLGDLPVEFDLHDDDVDYAKLYAKRR